MLNLKETMKGKETMMMVVDEAMGRGEKGEEGKLSDGGEA